MDKYRQLTDEIVSLDAEVDKLRKENAKLEDKLTRVYDSGVYGIYHVGAANYEERVIEAINKLEEIYFNG